jgi:hypothetical protein
MLKVLGPEVVRKMVDSLVLSDDATGTLHRTHYQVHSVVHLISPHKQKYDINEYLVIYGILSIAGLQRRSYL